MSELGLFPLPLVLLPTEQLPLHIFEDRYKELIGECLAEDVEFGLVFADDDGVRQIGTRARVLEVLPPAFPDGRMNVLVEGNERFRVVELTEGRSFHTADTAPVDDDDDPASDEVVERARMLFRRLREVTGSSVEVPDPALPQLSYALASRVELANEIKLGLLAEVSERLRLEQVCEILAEAAISVERQRRAAERAATNGKVDTSI